MGSILDLIANWDLGIRNIKALLFTPNRYATLSGFWFPANLVCYNTFNPLGLWMGSILDLIADWDVCFRNIKELLFTPNQYTTLSGFWFPANLVCYNTFNPLGLWMGSILDLILLGFINPEGMILL